MSEKDSNSIDILGIKPIGEAANTVAKGTVDGAAAFLTVYAFQPQKSLGFYFVTKLVIGVHKIL